MGFVSLTNYIFKTALRYKISWAFFLCLAIAASLSLFFGGASITEQDQFSVIFFASSMRFITVMFLVLLVAFIIRRAMDHNEAEYILSKPVSRLSYLSSHSVAFSSFTLLCVLAIMACFYMLPLTPQSLLIWGSGLLLESLIMVHAALFFALTLSNTVLVAFSCFALYTLGRLMGDILGILRSEIVSNSPIYLEKTMLFISVFVPRFDLLGQSHWLIYGHDITNMMVVFGQSVCFIAIFLTASYIDFKHKQF